MEEMKIYYDDLHNAIKTLHYAYGKGDIVQIRQFADGVLEVEAKKTWCKNHVSKGHLTCMGNNKYRINLYRHQKTVTIL